MRTYINIISALALLVVTGVTVPACAQVEGSALEHMLQRPQVAKKYEHKRLFDHLFVDAGAGINMMGHYTMQLGPTAEMGIGDWLSPEHGVRLNLGAGMYRSDGLEAKYANLGIDYLLNFTALAQRGTGYAPHRFEVYGIAGLDLGLSRNQSHTERGLGVHVGLRGQLALSSYTYFFAEPRIGVVDDALSQVPTWRGYRPLATATLGFGYRLPERGQRRVWTGDSTRTGRQWSDGLFVHFMGGPLLLVNSHTDTWSGNLGCRFVLGVGKWIDEYNALRLGFNVTTFDQNGDNNARALGVQLDYMANLHNAFGGILPDRRFWINAVAGVSYNLSTDDDHVHHGSFGVGAGLQGNVRLARGLALTVEPRIDVYPGNNYAPHAESFGGTDVTASLLAGLTYTYDGHRYPHKGEEPFVRNGWHSHIYVETAFGYNLDVMREAMRHPSDYWQGQLYAAVGKWFSPVHGARLWGQFARTQYGTGQQRYRHVDVGLDYTFNFTNAFYGFREDRKFEFTGAAGVNLSRRLMHDRLFFGGDLSLRGQWNVSPMAALFIEPRLQAYDDDFLPTTVGKAGLDFLASLNIGVQLRTDGYAKATAPHKTDDDGTPRNSFAISGGLASQVGHLRNTDYYGPITRATFTHWYSPVSAWRVNLQGMMRRKIEGQRYAQVVAGADWMADVTAVTYGYDASRSFAVRALVGANLGLDFGRHHTTFSPDVHVGGQFAVRLTDAMHVTVEPQMAYEFSSRFHQATLERWVPQLLVGLDYSMQRHERNADLRERPEHPNVVSASVGVGAYTGNFGEDTSLGRRLTFAGAVSYGRWIDHVNGVQAGVANTLVRRLEGGNQHITSAHVGYMMNVRSAVTGERTTDKHFQLTGIAALSVNVSTREGYDTKVTPGLMGALQGGIMVTPSVEVYVEPAFTLYTKSIESVDQCHPADGELRLSVGTKFHF